MAQLPVTAADVKDEEINGRDAALHSLEECLYYIQTVSNLIRFSSENVWEISAVPSQVYLNVDGLTGNTASVQQGDDTSKIPIHRYLTGMCLAILRGHREDQYGWGRIASLRQAAIELLQQLCDGPPAGDLLDIGLQDGLIDILSRSTENNDSTLQTLLIDLLSTILKLRLPREETPETSRRTQTSMETLRSPSQLWTSKEEIPKGIGPAFDNSLMDCLILGISSPANHSILERWVAFVNTCLPLLFGNSIQTLMPLVDCFIRTAEVVFQRLKGQFHDGVPEVDGCEEPVSVINSLLHGLEQVLAAVHDRMTQHAGHTSVITNPEHNQGFFGNMVSGVFSPEAQKSWSATANNRLIVLLCFKDAVRVSFAMWLWGDQGSKSTSRDSSLAASLTYTSLRLKNRTRRMLEHLLAVEALECLETLVEFWHDGHATNDIPKSSTVLNLLHALKGSRPKNTIPALFNAIYSRTNPQALDPSRKSTLTSELSDTTLAAFLTAYTRSMEDDALDEIWVDCMTFLRDVLGNPLPHRQAIPLLLEFTAVLSGKIDNTNFGEQRKMRRDIGVSCHDYLPISDN